MIPYNGFILSIFLMLPGASAPTAMDSACEAMDVTVTVSTADDKQGVIEILAPQDADLKVYLLGTEGGKPPVEVAIVKGKVKNVAPGQYDLILKDIGRKYCNHLSRVTVN